MNHPSPLTPHPSPKIKLLDFGLARHVVETESLNVTRAGAVIGTPLYMPPEQCSGQGTVTPRTDVYSLGATLFHLLAGRPPFVADTALALIAKHCNEPPPELQKLNPQLSDGVCQVVAKCLAKAPEDRYATAGALLADLERLLRGEPTGITVHPRMPDCDRQKVIRYDFTWELEASPRQLWPYVSNTERLNRAVGLPAVQFSAAVDPEAGVKRFGRFRKAGMLAAWREHPFEWVEGRRFGVLREYTSGPFKWLMSVVELEPRAGGGTTLTHRVFLEPSGWLGRTVAAVEVNLKGGRSLDRVYRRIDAALTGRLGDQAVVDPFEEPAHLSAARNRQLETLLDRLTECGIDPAVIGRLGDFLAHAPPQEVARIRPLALARRLALDAEQVVAACLHGAREGLFLLLWDILCPVCRIPSEIKDTLRALKEHGRCEACNLDFELDFANSVELIFRVHPNVRETELGTFCIGGPAHFPHVAAQVRVGPGERLELDLELPEGAYRLRGPQLPFTFDFRVQPAARAARVDLSLGRRPEPELPNHLKTGRQMMVLTNDRRHEVVARIERVAPREDALTAARASALALFRQLFPAEVLSPGQLVSVTAITLLVTDLDRAGEWYEQLGDARAFALIHQHFRQLEEVIRREGGALVKTVGEGVVAAFHDPVAAVRAGLEIATDYPPTVPCPKIGVHRGPAMVATLNDHLDYFGSTVNRTARLLQTARGGDLVLTREVAGDPQVAALLQSRGVAVEVIGEDAGEPVHRLVVPRGKEG